jgi:hypothetical protein
LNTSPGPFELGQGWSQQLAERSCGKANAPGATVCAIVMVVSGRDSEERLSQVAAAETRELGIVITIAAKMIPSSFIRSPFQALREPTTKTGKKFITNKL